MLVVNIKELHTKFADTRFGN